MYRQLSESEITTLEKQGCVAEKWENVTVQSSFTARNVRNVHFAGKVQLGSLLGKIQIEEGIIKSSALHNSYIENCIIGDQVYISDVGSLVNYSVGNHVVIENVGKLAVHGVTFFGNGTEIEVLNEGGGRELPLFEKLSAQLAYLLVLYRNNSALIEKLKKQIADFVESKKSSSGIIAEHSVIQYSKMIENVNIGPFSCIKGATKLKEGTIVSKEQAPVFIGEDVVAENFIVLSDSKIDSGAIISNTFVGQGVRMGKQNSAENSVFFANCEAFHGEACSIFAGPYTVTHHKSSLLIAGMFSFFNAGSGTNQSNHMYKLGPVHQGIVERGSKTGSFSYMLWPCRIGAFSVVMDKHSGNFDTSELPFSYINVQDGKSVVTPAMNLFTVGTARDGKKWPVRDRRNDPEKLDLINFEILNPYTVQKIIDGTELLSMLNESTPKTKEYATHKGIHINRLMLRTSIRYYDLAVNVYLTRIIIEKLFNSNFHSLKEIRALLHPGEETKQCKWVDLAGMITDRESVNRIIDAIISEEVKSLDDTLTMFSDIFSEYKENAYAWSMSVLKSYGNIDVAEITRQELLQIISDYKMNAVKFNNMILKDAEKEFDQQSRIGFGIDGDEGEKVSDFEAIRGTYESNSFVNGIKDEIAGIESKCEILIRQLGELPE
jgi:NDP-sugar pyrophosphorylase family protein